MMFGLDNHKVLSGFGLHWDLLSEMKLFGWIYEHDGLSHGTFGLPAIRLGQELPYFVRGDGE